MPYRCFSVIVISQTFCISFDFFSCVLYYIKLHYITLSYYLVYASLLSLLQLFFCLHVRLLYVIKYYLLTYMYLAPDQRQEFLQFVSLRQTAAVEMFPEYISSSFHRTNGWIERDPCVTR